MKSGKLALQLVEKKGSIQYKSSVICFVYDRILWATEPLQLIVNAHLLGRKYGHQSGDCLYALNNQILAIKADYSAGHCLDKVRTNIMDFFSVLKGHGLKVFANFPAFLLSQIMVLQGGLHMAAVAHGEDIPSEVGILSNARSGSNVVLYGKIHHLTRSYLFRQMGNASLNIDISGTMAEGLNQLNLFHVMGYFFEGLSAFLLARKTCDNKYAERGQSVLSMMKCWSEHSLWNWENKVLLLEAESMFTIGEFDRAVLTYDSAIRCAREHKFIHEEAIASELAGTFYYERGIYQKSYSLLVHSVESYRTWGAHAIAGRVESVIGHNFGAALGTFVPSADISCDLCAPSLLSQKKRSK